MSLNWARRLFIVPACAVLLLAMAGNLSAQLGQGKVTGLVTDQTTGEALVGVQVYLEGMGIGALTSDNGRFFIINVPPGTYTVVAELIGYATVRKENVLVAIDVTRVLDFQMPASAVAVEELVVEVETTPLIEIAATGSSDVTTAAQIDLLPVTNLAEVLALQQGFLVVPQNTDVISYLDTRRGITPVRIRGGRGGETITLVDGIPINNFLLGGPAMSVSNMAVEQVDYIRGGFPAKYGNALSGVVNIKTRDPGTSFRGQLRYQTSGVAGALGNNYADLLDYHQLEGYVSGPVPGTSDKLRFVVAGQNRNQSDRVLQFDNDITNPLSFTRNERNRYESVYDLVPGWQGLGFDDRRDVFGKLVYYFSPTAKLGLSGIDYQRQTLPYDFAWMQSGFDLYGQCVKNYPDLEDICNRTYLEGVNPEQMQDFRGTYQENTWMAQSSIDQRRSMWAVNWDHTLGRFAYNVAGGGLNTERESCVFVSGVCLGSRIAWRWSNANFVESGGSTNFGAHPIYGTDDNFGRDKSNSWFLRGDGQWQATDHHNVGFGFEYRNHDVELSEGFNVGLNNVQIEWNQYAGTPWDAAVYVQDRIEYDFITVDLGFRFDYGKASGLFFANPQDPTNGTTAYEVCESPEDFGLPGDWASYTDPTTGQEYSGFPACAKDPGSEGTPTLLNQAIDQAMMDDFQDAQARSQFSPRLGISFPVTARSSLFFNYGRFAQNPLLNNLYRQTSIGMCNHPQTGAAGVCGGDFTVPIEGSRNAISSVVNSTVSQLVGNPQLLTEQTSSYEFGFLTEIGDNWGLSAILYSKDQYGLTGVRSGGVTPEGDFVFDAGTTYGTSTFEYSVLLNLDYQTARGIELSLRKRLADYWGLSINYHFSRILTNAAAPELEIQKRDEGDQQLREEVRSEIDQPHVLNGVLNFATGEQSPLGAWLKNASASFVLRVASGMPYTPSLDEEGWGARAERNSGTGPTTWRVDMNLRKNFRFRGMFYGFFLRVTNLFNTKNCVQVFTSTGNCDYGTVTDERQRIGGFTYTGGLSQSWDRPDYLGTPRWASFGMQVSF
jgi:outer membrane receptor protein involved in Fe transport